MLKKLYFIEKCVTTVIEKMKGDERMVSYKATAEEAESAGKKIVDSKR